MGDDCNDPLLCTVCGAEATRYIGKTGVLPICDLPSCFERRIDEVNVLIKELNKDELEAFHVADGII